MRRFVNFLLLMGVLCLPFNLYAGGGKGYSAGGGKSAGAGGGKSYSAGGKPSVTPGKSYSAGGAKPASTGKSYGAGSGKPAGGKPSDNSFSKSQRSKGTIVYPKGPSPATSYKDSKGRTVNLDPKDKKIQRLRNQLTEERWQNRRLRQEQFYHNYYSRPVVVYHDPYSSFFWWWLLDRSIEQQAMWAYHHRYDMDSARYNDLLAKNAQLAARVNALESQRVARDPSYKPVGMTEEDLMYDDDYVKAVVNPNDGSDSAAMAIVCVFMFGLFLCFLIWLLFYKRF